MTLNDTISTTEKYLSQPTITKVKVMKNDTIDLGPATLCVELVPENFFFSPNKSTSLSDLFRDNYMKGLVETLDDNPKSVAKLAYLLFVMSRLETGNSDGLNPNLVDIVLEFYRYININNLTMQNIMKRLGKKLCVLMNIRIKNESLCHELDLRWLGSFPSVPDERSYMCLRVKSDFFHFNSLMDWAPVSADTSALYPQNPDTARKGFIFLEFSESNFIDEDSENVMQISMTSSKVIVTQIAGIYEKIPTANSICVSHEDTNKCIYKCKLKTLQSIAKCLPQSWVLHLSESFSAMFCAYQMVDKYRQDRSLVDDQLKDISSAYEISKRCLSKCPEVCVAKIISHRLLELSPLVPTDRSFFICVDTFIYPLFQESLAMDMKSFLSTLGGNLNFYIGASFIALIHVLMFHFRYLIEILVHKLKKNPTGNESTPKHDSWSSGNENDRRLSEVVVIPGHP